MIEQLLVLEGTSIPEELRDIAVTVVHVTANVVKKISGMQSVDSTAVIAVMKMPRSFCDLGINGSDAMFYSLLPSPHRLLVLDGIQVLPGFSPFNIILNYMRIILSKQPFT